MPPLDKQRHRGGVVAGHGLEVPPMPEPCAGQQRLHCVSTAE
jgi:hypothetical protein